MGIRGTDNGVGVSKDTTSLTDDPWCHTSKLRRAILAVLRFILFPVEAKTAKTLCRGATTNGMRHGRRGNEGKATRGRKKNEAAVRSEGQTRNFEYMRGARGYRRVVNCNREQCGWDEARVTRQVMHNALRPSSSLYRRSLSRSSPSSDCRSIANPLQFDKCFHQQSLARQAWRHPPTLERAPSFCASCPTSSW